jgi:hypothetical protein
MSWSRSASYWLSSALLLVAGCDAAPRVQVLGETTRLARERPSPRKSAIFDGQRVSLRAARGETLGVQLRIGDSKRREVRLRLPEAAARVQPFQVQAIEVKQPSTSMYGRSTGAGAYPDVLRPVADAVATSELAYFDVAVPATAEPGRYEGRLQLDAESVPVTLEVSSARIDLAKAPLVWVFYLPREIAAAHGLADGESPELIEREAEYDRLFRAHGAFLAADLPPARFPARRRFMREVKYWPVAIDISSEAAITRDVQQWLELFRDSGVTPFAIPIDEPRTLADKQRARQIAEQIGRAGGGRPALLRAVTDQRLPVYGDSIDVYISPVNFPEGVRAGAPRGERFWTYNGKPPSAGSMILDSDGVALRTWGWIAERYGIELWYAWEGLYFSDRYNRGGPTDVLRDSITFDERSRGGSDFGNGDGLLVYPGPLPSLRLKALRRGLQDRLLLGELRACGAAERARRIVATVMPRALGEARDDVSWSIDEPAWELARKQVLDGIEQECNAAAMAR